MTTRPADQSAKRPVRVPFADTSSVGVSSAHVLLVRVRVLIVVAVALGLGFAAAGAPAAESAMLRSPSAKAWAPKSLDVRFVMAINELRSEHDLQPLEVDARLQHAAHDWSRTMADGLFLEHAPDIALSSPPGAVLLGENVGRGMTVPRLMAAFEASPTHLDNILAANWTHIGVGTVRADDGRIYTTHRFAERVLPPG